MNISLYPIQNSIFKVHEVKLLSFRSTWSCISPPIYDNKSPVSLIIIRQMLSPNFSYPTYHNQNVSLALL